MAAAIAVRSGRRRWLGLAAALLALAVLFAASLAVGARHLELATVWQALRHDDGSDAAYIVRALRLPRGILAVLVGAALGLAGALMQALTRNPLADPGLMGVEIGASTAIVTGIAFFGVTAPSGYVWFAFAGAMAASVIVYTLGASGRAPTPERIVVAGAAVTAALGAFVSAVLLLRGEVFDRFRFWVVGSLANRGFDVLWQVGPFIVAGALLALALSRGLNVLALGEDTGRALGARAGRIRLAGAVAVTLLCGAATAAAGPIGFVGLTVPHVARMITGPDNGWVLPYSAVLAPILVLGADVVGRVVAAPGELEVGIVMAFVGAPVFIALCRRTRIAQL
ncbi:iron chelate uptake ABC transporter family permease subunit [Dactylosporangium sp. AC04546]|uniref:FecCD family ABC transporter permease n=1 Tax=Dactylosporangium sp. AC04546 TaxID=2862460 RepID=UPI001EDD821E|nr:iron chelate uptake ABC transporter family permease subunit [Dactylosporangium sp. AC04546]WVK88955.1 iron chelate uptake ABC transporter family permease subunit [Dactylosporangium sp. AC04546]